MAALSFVSLPRRGPDRCPLLSVRSASFSLQISLRNNFFPQRDATRLNVRFVECLRGVVTGAQN